jgi:DNA-binding winged helix-turn-helix (wHTH) protein/tetratricopeptide (TPR) repeat protein
MIRFGRYTLDATQGLARAGKEVRLTPKSLAVLWILADRAGRVVTKAELFDSAWPDAAVTDSALATCVQEIRRALGDDPRTPRYIETVHRRGYRFVAPTTQEAAAAPVESMQLPPTAPLVGRQHEVGVLIQAFERARGGARQICLVSGEAGVGKSAVLAETLARLREQDGVAMTWANCIEQYGSGEPYQPLLDGLMRLCRGPAGDRTIATLERYAPMWLAQLPGLLAPRDAAALQQRLVGAMRDRMLRELTNAIEVLASTDTVVLAIEDLHWSDPSTLDWLANVSSRTDPCKLMVIATMRPASGDEADDQLARLRETLGARRLVLDVSLAGLPAKAVAEYVLRALPPAPGRSSALEQLAERVHHHTGGNPLFIGTVLDQLVEHGVVKRASDGWDVSHAIGGADLGIPGSIRPVIARQIDRLPPVQRQVLEAASVMGDAFDVAVVAQAAAMDPDDAETSLRHPASQRFVRTSTAVLADDRRSPHLEFVHALFRDALYERIPRSRRSALHRQMAVALEQVMGPRAGEIGAELALHFELGGDEDRAIHYLQRAGDLGRRRSAFREARRHYEHALELLEHQPDDDARAARELDLQIGLGAATMATAGFGAPAVEAAYSRARALGQRIGDAPGRFPALFGLWLFYWGRGEVRTATGLAGDLRRRAGRSPDLRLQAAHSAWSTAFSRGEFAESRRHVRIAMALYEQDRHAGMAASYGGHDAASCGGMFAGRASAIMGLADDATTLGEAAVAHARSLDQPFSIGLALTFRAASLQALGDREAALTYANEAMAIARDQGFRLMLGWCMAISGWAAVRNGEVDRGGAWIDEAIATTRATGSEQFLSWLMATRAEAYLASDRPAEALQAATDGLAAVAQTAEGFFEAELHRLQGEALLAQEGDAAALPSLRKAVDVASRQGASLFALRAANRLVHLTGGGNSDLDLLRAARAAASPNSSLAEALDADVLLATLAVPGPAPRA